VERRRAKWSGWRRAGAGSCGLCNTQLIYFFALVSSLGLGIIDASLRRRPVASELSAVELPLLVIGNAHRLDIDPFEVVFHGELSLFAPPDMGHKRLQKFTPFVRCPRFP
jgi:hypothetical protein